MALQDVFHGLEEDKKCSSIAYLKDVLSDNEGAQRQDERL